MEFIARWGRLAGAAMLALLFSAAVAWAASFKPGDKVQVWNSDWYNATILSVGTDNYAGYYYVQYDGRSGGGSQQYIRADNIRARPGAAAPAGAGARPDGRFACFGYNGGSPMFRWYLDISGGTYQQHTPDLAAGHYAIDGQRMTFVSGPYASSGWIGLLTTSNGTISKIALRNRADEAKGPQVNAYATIFCSPH